jgi:hypothetical protein
MIRIHSQVAMSVLSFGRRVCRTRAGSVLQHDCWAVSVEEPIAQG